MTKIEVLKKSIDQWEIMLNLSLLGYSNSIETLKRLAFEQMNEDNRPHANCFLCDYALGKTCEDECPMYGHWPSLNGENVDKCMNNNSVFYRIYEVKELSEIIEIILNAMKDRLKEMKGENKLKLN